MANEQAVEAALVEADECGPYIASDGCWASRVPGFTGMKALAAEVRRLRGALEAVGHALPVDDDSYDGTANPVIRGIVNDALAGETENNDGSS